MKTIDLTDFTNQEVDFISEMVMEKLADMGIDFESFSFGIVVDYVEGVE